MNARGRYDDTYTRKGPGKARFTSASPSWFPTRCIFNFSGTMPSGIWVLLPLLVLLCGSRSRFTRRDQLLLTDGFTRPGNSRNTADRSDGGIGNRSKITGHPWGILRWKNRKTVWWSWWIERYKAVRHKEDTTACNAILHLCQRSGRRPCDSSVFRVQNATRRNTGIARNHSYNEDLSWERPEQCKHKG
jgi:hypothetical protein